MTVVCRKSRAFLKWAGGKYGLVDTIRRHLPDSELLIEPFVGAGSVFLNTDYPSYQLNDINADLIALYRLLKSRHQHYIADARALFTTQHNQKDAYLSLRQQFNHSTDPYERSVLFLYLNRHGYNGLCRYNLSGKFNVPFGSYKKPYFPAAIYYLENGKDLNQALTWVNEAEKAMPKAPYVKLWKGKIQLKQRPLPAHVTLVDDVITTGATLDYLSSLLKAKGVQTVSVWTLAITRAF